MTAFSSVYCLLLATIVISKVSSQFSFNRNHPYICNNNAGNYTDDNTYDMNLNTLLSTLTSNKEIDYGFYNFTYGENSEKVYAIGLCREDVNPDECRSCLTISAAKLTEICPIQKEVIGWFENGKCMLRYTNRSIFGVMETYPAYYLVNTRNATQEDEFNSALSDLLSSLIGKASLGDNRRKNATASVAGSNFQTIYGLVQCTPDLSVANCSDCLNWAMSQIPACCNNKIGATILNPSCNLRYEISPFLNEPPAYAPSPMPTSPGKSNTATLGLAIVIPVAATVMFIFICICLRRRKRWEKFKTHQEEYGDEIDISESLQFSFKDIRHATNDFSDSNKLGQGGFGAVYRGRLSNEQDIAVKRLSTNSRQGDIEFKNEVLLVAKLQHRNLVRLLGFCLEGRERLLVYEFVPNKSLDYFIFDQTKRAQLNWETRYKIIEAIARGILYLHQDSRLRIIHRDLKASNILLDEEMNPKISDFGLARLFVVNQTQGDTNRIVGTYGYMAPEYAMHGQFSEKSDVFSFGVLILEIVSGKKNRGIHHGENIEDLLTFAWQNWKEGTATNIVDHALNNCSENEIRRCIHIGLLCVQENVAARPTMASVVHFLNSDSVTLPVSLEPAFYVDDNRTENLQDMQLWEFNSGTRSSEDTARSAQESINEVSITYPYPR